MVKNGINDIHVSLSLSMSKSIIYIVASLSLSLCVCLRKRPTERGLQEFPSSNPFLVITSILLPYIHCQYNCMYKKKVLSKRCDQQFCAFKLSPILGLFH